MKKYAAVSTCIALLLAGAPVFAQKAKENKSTGKATQTQTLKDVKKAESSAETKAAQPQVDKSKEEEMSAKRQAILKEALSAVSNTREALKALDENKTDEALTMLASVTGKLEVVLSRDPDLEFVPVNVTESVTDLISDVSTLKALLKEAGKALKSGKVQEARHLLADASSEIVISTTSIPLLTYPDAIKAVVPLIDDGKTEEAKAALQAALNSLVITDEVIPLPPLRARLMLEKAEKLAENEKRTEEESKNLSNLLNEAKTQLEMGELLGYGDKQAFKEIYSEINSIKERIDSENAGQGWFDTVKKELSALAF